MTQAETELKNIIKNIKEEGDALELNLQGVKFPRFTPTMKDDIQELKGLEVMILIDCGLETLEGFPKINLQAIDLSKNNLTDDSCLNVLAEQKNLAQIFAANNKIEKIASIMELKSLPNLVEVDFSENPVSENTQYPKTIFENFPEISIVDAKDKDGKEVENEEQFQDDDDDQDEDQYEGEEDSEQFDEDEEDEQQSEDKQKKGKKRRG